MTHPKVFVSHASGDKAIANKVRRVLRSVSAAVWTDGDLAAGAKWKDELRANLRDSDVFVFIVTPKTFVSEWQMQELGAAWSLEKHIITVATDPRLLRELPVALSQARSVTVDEIERMPDLIARAA